jgi:hypothetical protein
MRHSILFVLALILSFLNKAIFLIWGYEYLAFLVVVMSIYIPTYNVGTRKASTTRGFRPPLKGEYKDCREFHISGDLLIIYFIADETLNLIRIGSHSQLFK